MAWIDRNNVIIGRWKILSPSKIFSMRDDHLISYCHITSRLFEDTNLIWRNTWNIFETLLSLSYKRHYWKCLYDNEKEGFKALSNINLYTAIIHINIDYYARKAKSKNDKTSFHKTCYKKYLWWICLKCVLNFVHVLIHVDKWDYFDFRLTKKNLLYFYLFS